MTYTLSLLVNKSATLVVMLAGATLAFAFALDAVKRMVFARLRID